MTYPSNLTDKRWELTEGEDWFITFLFYLYTFAVKHNRL